MKIKVILLYIKVIRFIQILTIFCITFYSFADDIIINYGSSWKYLDNGSNQGFLWKNVGFDDSGWSTGNAQLGYGDGDEATSVSYGADPNNKYITTYFRKEITIGNTSNFLYYTLNYKRDDGIIIYIDGAELARNNMPVGAITYTTLASAAAGDDGNGVQSMTIDLSVLPQGTHTLAVEIHQNAVNSSDISFDLQLIANTHVIAYNAAWKYLDNGSNQGTAWYGTGFNDASWASGNGQLGYGDGDEATLLSYGADPNNKYITTYFRKNFLVGNTTGIINYTMNVRRDDGIIVYLDGVEIYRNNMPAGAPTFTTLASAAAGDDGNADQSTTLTVAQLPTGSHLIAAEVHQNAGTSSDISFDLQLVANRPGVIRGPYLQMGLPTSGVIRWRTNTPTDSRVRYGTTLGTYTITVTDAAIVTDHEIQLTGLTPNTRYYYTIETTSQVFESNANNTFLTYPNVGTKKEYNFLVFGDCGNFSTNQFNVRNAYLNFMQGRHTDGFLLLGDNAYNSGFDAEYQTNFYNVYRDSILKDTWLWPAPGNHDYANTLARQNDHNIPYYTMFTLPTAGEAGGVASGTEAFYSYNIGNIHFIALDSYGRELSTFRLYDTLGPQAIWLKDDLSANTLPWVVVYFHHPPYTMGSHNSDTETELINMRQNVMPILERYGVDIVLCGHSHDYERSYLLKGHFGLENTFNLATHTLSNSSARWDNTVNSCPYIKSLNNKNGTVYNLIGSAGQLGGSQASFPHNAMNYSNVTNGGALALTINDNRLDAKWVCADGIVRDQYTILKDVNKNFSYTITLGDVINLSATWEGGTYLWSNNENTKQISVSPIVEDNIFFAKDNFNCVKDTFNVKVVGGLPVQLSSFEVSKYDNTQSLLQWTTLSEINNEKFIVEWSTNSKDFVAITSVDGAGTSNTIHNYSFIHSAPNMGWNYYRLLQVDFDGHTSYSDVHSIHFAEPEKYLLYPNPNDGTFTLNFYNSNNLPNALITIVDIQGRVLYQEDRKLYNGDNGLLLQISLPKGQYYCILGGMGKTLSFDVLQ